MKLILLHFLLFVVIVGNGFSQGGDDCASAVSINSAGNYVSDNSAGDQWYLYQNTSGAEQILRLSTCGLTSENTYLSLYLGCGDAAVATSDDFCLLQSEISLTVPADVVFYIAWGDNYTSSSYNWVIEELDNGCSEAQPIQNFGSFSSSNADGDQWFYYENESDEAIMVNVSSCGLTNADTYLLLYSDCQNLLNESDDFCRLQSSSFADISPGGRLYIRWSSRYNNGPFNWQIVKITSGGDTCQTSESIPGSGVYVSDNANGDQWYSYTNARPDSVKLTVSSCGFTLSDTYLEIYKECGDDVAILNNNLCGLQSELEYELTANETVYIRWRDTDNDSLFTWSVELEEVERLPPTTCENPKEITETAV